MKRTQPATVATLTVLLMLIAAGAVGAAPGDHVWSRGFDHDIQTGITPDGGVIGAEMFYSTIDFGGGPLTPTSAFGADMYVVKYDAAGNHVFSFAIEGGQSHQVQAVRADGAGGVYVMGRIFAGSVDFGGGPLAAASSFFVVRYDASGAHVFSGLHGDVEMADAEADGQGLVIVGATRSTADFGGGPLTTAGDADALIARLDGAGNHVFSAIYGDQYYQYAWAVGTDGAGRPIMAVQIAGDTDFGGGSLSPSGFGLALVALDEMGAHIRSTLIEGDFTSGITYNTHLDVDVAGGFVVAGSLHGAADFGGGALYSAGGTDVYVAAFDTDGSHRFSQSYGSTSYQVVHSVSLLPSGAILLSGNFVNDLDFGGGPLSASSDTAELFLARLNASGGHEFSTAYQASGAAYGLVSRANAGGAILLQASASPDLDLGGGPLGDHWNFIGVLEGDATASDVAGGNIPGLLTGVSVYPNPFNPATTLAFTLGHGGDVEIVVYDLRGTLVARVHRGELSAGSHAVTWRADGAPAGVYLATVRTGRVMRTLPIMLVK